MSKPTIEELEAQITELQETIDRLQEPQEINLKDGGWTIYTNGNVETSNSYSTYRNAGAEYQTEAQAKISSKRMVQANRVQARAFEIDPDFVDEFDYTIHNEQLRGKSYSLYSHSGKWVCTGNTAYRELGTPIMLKATAIQICEEINSGRFPI